MSNGFIYVVDAHFIDKLKKKKSWTQVHVDYANVKEAFILTPTPPFTPKKSHNNHRG